MILGVHSATFVKNWHEDVMPYIHKCKKAGYKSVEVSLLGQTPSSAKNISKLAKDLNITHTCTTGLSKEEDISSGDSGIQKSDHVRKLSGNTELSNCSPTQMSWSSSALDLMVLYTIVARF